MIDIIIPVYNSHNTLFKTLANLSIQSGIENAKIYLVNDCSKKDYSSFIKEFTNLNIIELKTPRNIGPGGARQYGLDNSNGDFVFFIDSDDQLYDIYSFNTLYCEIKNNDYDLIYGSDYSEEYGIDSINTGSLHGKMYRRSFLEKFNIRFNNTRYSEDNSFNNLALGCSISWKKLGNITYLYMKNANSITSDDSKKYEILKMYFYNKIWLTLELKRRNICEAIIADKLLDGYICIFHKVKENPDFDCADLYSSCYRIEEFYSYYEKYLAEKYIEEKLFSSLIDKKFNPTEIINEFNTFRSKFRGCKND